MRRARQGTAVMERARLGKLLNRALSDREEQRSQSPALQSSPITQALERHLAGRAQRNLGRDTRGRALSGHHLQQDQSGYGLWPATTELKGRPISGLLTIATACAMDDQGGSMGIDCMGQKVQGGLGVRND